MVVGEQRLVAQHQGGDWDLRKQVYSTAASKEKEKENDAGNLELNTCPVSLTSLF